MCLVRRFLMMQTILTPSWWGSRWQHYVPLKRSGIVTTNSLSSHHRRPESSTLNYFVLLPHTVQQTCGTKRGCGQQITSVLILSISCQRCAFSLRFGIKLWSWGVDCCVMTNRDSPLHQAFSVPVLLCSVSHTAPKDVRYISCSHCRNACCWLGGWWIWQFTMALWCPVHLHQNCTVIRWWGQGAIVSQSTCQTTHAATETLP